MTKLDSLLKNKRHHFADKGPYRESYDFSNTEVKVGDCKEGQVPKN